MEKEIKLIIGLPPVTKKNSQQILYNRATNRAFIAPSAKYKAYEKACAVYVHGRGEPIDYPVNVKCIYYMPTRRRVDLCNLLEATCDILVKYGVLQDDNSNIVVAHDESRVYYDKDNPRTEVIITQMEGR